MIRAKVPAGSQTRKECDSKKSKALIIKEKKEEENRAINTKMIIKRSQNAHGKIPNVLVRFEPKKYTTKDGTSQVFIFVYVGGKRVFIQTGVYIKPSHWDEKNLCVKKSVAKADKLNLIIRDTVARVNDILVMFQLKKIEVSAETLLHEFSKPSYGFDFIDFMERAIKDRKGMITDSTIAQHSGILSKLKEYKERILSEDLTDEFFIQYDKYLKTTLKNSPNTRHGNLKTIRSYIQIAIRQKLMDKITLASNPAKQISGKRTFLSDEDYREMIKLYRTGLLSDSLQNVLRWFLFSCQTGLRISDIRRIKFDDIVGDILVITPYKTTNVNGKTIKIPLMEFAKQLINDEGNNHIDGLIFNCIADQNMNEYIKIIARDHCLIKYPISWHTSRHTFATIFLRNTKDLGALQKILGHANIRETMIYAHTMTEDVKSAMQFQNNY